MKRKETDFFVKCEDKITHILAKTESHDYEIAPKTEKSNSIQEFWISENQYAKISSFTKTTEYHDTQKYNEIQRLIMENEDIPNKFQTIYEKMKPKSFLINLVMIIITILVVLGTVINTWNCIKKKCKRRRQKRNINPQEIEMIIQEDDDQTRPELPRERRSRTYHRIMTTFITLLKRRRNGRSRIGR